jgi:hypothetical protein
MKFNHLPSTRSNEMIQEQQTDNETGTTTMEDDSYFDSYEDIEVRSILVLIVFYISPSCSYSISVKYRYSLFQQINPQKFGHSQMWSIVNHRACTLLICSLR